MKSSCSLLLAIAGLFSFASLSAHAKDKAKQEASYETSGQQAIDLMAAHEQYLVAQIQLNLARQAYADAISKIRRDNGWGPDVVFNDQSHKWEKSPSPEPAKSDPAKPATEETKPKDVKPEEKNTDPKS